MLCWPHTETSMSRVRALVYCRLSRSIMYIVLPIIFNNSNNIRARNRAATSRTDRSPSRKRNFIIIIVVFFFFFSRNPLNPAAHGGVIFHEYTRTCLLYATTSPRHDVGRTAENGFPVPPLTASRVAYTCAALVHPRAQ